VSDSDLLLEVRRRRQALSTRAWAPGSPASVLDAIAGRPYRAHAQMLCRTSASRCGEASRSALIGENGAGKSTLLRMICGIAEPSAGQRPTVAARVAPLLELGAGFHPDYSGRDNIRMNALLLGMPATEIDAKVQQVIDFAEIGAYIDEPVKHYSSGMKVRLGFAVVASAQAGPADHRRGAGGRRRVLPEEVHRLDRGLPARGRHAAAGQPQHVPRAEAVQARLVAAPAGGSKPTAMCSMSPSAISPITNASRTQRRAEERLR
jgi:hypothetical protein